MQHHVKAPRGVCGAHVIATRLVDRSNKLLLDLMDGWREGMEQPNASDVLKEAFVPCLIRCCTQALQQLMQVCVPRVR